MLKQLGEEVYQAYKEKREAETETLFNSLETVEGFIENFTNELSGLKGMMICTSCGAEIPDYSQLCPCCGNKVERNNMFTCPNCGKQLEKDMKFCTQCGTKVG